MESLEELFFSQKSEIKNYKVNNLKNMRNTALKKSNEYFLNEQN